MVDTRKVKLSGSAGFTAKTANIRRQSYHYLEGHVPAILSLKDGRRRNTQEPPCQIVHPTES